MAKYHRLTQENRYQIEALKTSGLSVRAIAKQLDLSPSTISRELRRNAPKRKYFATTAHKLAQARRRIIHPPVKVIGEMASRIEELFKKQWSPEQISGRLHLTEGIKVSHESIYQFVFKNYKEGGDLYKYLRRGRKKRKKRTSLKKQQEVYQKGKSMKDRPEIVEKRSRVGDYERDSIVSKGHKGGVLTIVDRASRLLRMSKVDRIASAVTHDKTIDLLQGLELKTMTNDNGTEFALWHITREVLGVDIFFNRPYSSWERGTNENTNGLVRQFFPKGTDFTTISEEDIGLVELSINTRPRKCLGYKTALEFYNEHCPNKLVWKELGEEELKRLEFLLSTRSKKRTRSHRISKSEPVTRA